MADKRRRGRRKYVIPYQDLYDLAPEKRPREPPPAVLTVRERSSRHNLRSFATQPRPSTMAVNRRLSLRIRRSTGPVSFHDPSGADRLPPRRQVTSLGDVKPSLPGMNSPVTNTHSTNSGNYFTYSSRYSTIKDAMQSKSLQARARGADNMRDTNLPAPIRQRSVREPKTPQDLLTHPTSTPQLDANSIVTRMTGTVRIGHSFFESNRYGNLENAIPMYTTIGQSAFGQMTEGMENRQQTDLEDRVAIRSKIPDESLSDDEVLLPEIKESES